VIPRTPCFLLLEVFDLLALPVEKRFLVRENLFELAGEPLGLGECSSETLVGANDLLSGGGQLGVFSLNRLASLVDFDFGSPSSGLGLDSLALLLADDVELALCLPSLVLGNLRLCLRFTLGAAVFLEGERAKDNQCRQHTDGGNHGKGLDAIRSGGVP
jgi:hypothetical protein